MELEEQIIQYLSQQNEKGIEMLMSLYGGLLKSVIRKHLYSLQSHQEECLNDTLLAIWNNWESFDPERSNF